MYLSSGISQARPARSASRPWTSAPPPRPSLSEIPVSASFAWVSAPLSVCLLVWGSFLSSHFSDSQIQVKVSSQPHLSQMFCLDWKRELFNWDFERSETFCAILPETIYVFVGLFDHCPRVFPIAIIRPHLWPCLSNSHRSSSRKNISLSNGLPFHIRRIIFQQLCKRVAVSKNTIWEEGVGNYCSSYLYSLKLKCQTGEFAFCQFQWCMQPWIMVIYPSSQLHFTTALGRPRTDILCNQNFPRLRLFHLIGGEEPALTESSLTGLSPNKNRNQP